MVNSTGRERRRCLKYWISNKSPEGRMDYAHLKHLVIGIRRDLKAAVAQGKIPAWRYSVTTKQYTNDTCRLLIRADGYLYHSDRRRVMEIVCLSFPEAPSGLLVWIGSSDLTPSTWRGA
jgi:hypothetical protein